MSDITQIARIGLSRAMDRMIGAASTIARQGLPIADNGKPLMGQPAIQPDGAALNVSEPAGDDGSVIGAVVDMKLAETAYRANAMMLRTADDMQRELLRDLRV